MHEPPPGARDQTNRPPPEAPTGHPEVDAALAKLPDLDELPVAEHAGRYDEIQRRLDAVLTGTSIDDKAIDDKAIDDKADGPADRPADGGPVEGATRGADPLDGID